jgi:hypothetical protein
MRIDIDKLTEAELIDLNNRVVARLQFLAQMRAHAQMLEFKIGDRVSFQPDGHRRVVGMLTRYNRKTVTVITDDGQRWNVSPRLLGRADEPQRSGRRDRGGAAGGRLQLALPGWGPGCRHRRRFWILTLPPLTEEGELPAGVHPTPLSESACPGISLMAAQELRDSHGARWFSVV